LGQCSGVHAALHCASWWQSDRETALAHNVITIRARSASGGVVRIGQAGDAHPGRARIALAADDREAAAQRGRLAAAVAKALGAVREALRQRLRQARRAHRQHMPDGGVRAECGRRGRGVVQVRPAGCAHGALRCYSSCLLNIALCWAGEQADDTLRQIYCKLAMSAARCQEPTK